MAEIKTVDVKGLEHEQREALIFPGIRGLNPGDTLRLVVEFNPVPLVFVMKAEGLETSYEKEGPDEWVLLAKKPVKSDEDKKAQFRALISEMKTDTVSPEAQARAKELFNSLDAKALGMLEQELIREGVSHNDIRQSLCDIHLEALKDSLVSQRMEVSSPHPVHTLMEEHEHILASLRELGGIAQRTKSAMSFSDMGADMEKLKEAAHHMIDSENHHKREEESLFPAMEKHDVVEPALIMKLDHEEFKKYKQELFKLANNPEDYEFSHFKSRVIAIGEYLSKEMDSHIFKENNILYQIALQVLTPEEWDNIKRECDKIGYCCFVPEDQRV